MIKNNIKVILFASLIVGIILPVSALNFADADTPIISKRIQKPVETESHKEIKIQVKALFLERLALMQDNYPLKVKYQENGLQSLNGTERKIFKENLERIQEISDEVKAINVESQKEFAITPEKREFLTTQKMLVENSNIPWNAVGVDTRVKSVMVMFTSQELADQYIPELDKLLTAPYYIKIGESVDWVCANQDSDCDPLIGGIEIGTENRGVSEGGYDGCSISVPMVRNTLFGTEQGFVTAAHCFANKKNVLDNGWNNEAVQPFGGSRVGQVTAIVKSGECDCAFVKIDEGINTFFGYWGGYMQMNELTSKSDPIPGTYVIMIGNSTGIQSGQVMLEQITSGTANMFVIDTAMDHGDSGGIVIDMETFSVYQGLIKGGIQSVETHIIPWSHIDNALDLQ